MTTSRKAAEPFPPSGFFLFTAADLRRVAAREITVTWRLWKYAHVRAGRAYPAGHGSVVIEDVRQVRAAEVTDADAVEARLPDVRSLIELVRSHTRAAVTPDTVLYRVQFRYLGETDPRPPPPLPDLEHVATRLGRLDGTSRHGPWTLHVLRMIEENPRVVSRQLANEVGWETADFKAHVRKLKALGLTVSCEVGYELSESGQSYLDSVAESAI